VVVDALDVVRGADVVTRRCGDEPRGTVDARAAEVTGAVVEATLDDVCDAGVVTRRCGDAPRGTVDVRAAAVAGGVVDLPDDAGDAGAATGRVGDATRVAAGDRAVEAGKASLPTAIPMPKTASAANAIPMIALPARRGSARPPAASARCGTSGGGDGCGGGPGATEAFGTATSSCGSTGTSLSSESARSRRSGETRTSSGLSGGSGSRSTIRMRSLARTEILTAPPGRRRAQAGDGARTRDPQLGKRVQFPMDKRFACNPAERYPLQPVGIRSSWVVTGAQLAHTSRSRSGPWFESRRAQIAPHRHANTAWLRETGLTEVTKMLIACVHRCVH